MAFSIMGFACSKCGSRDLRTVNLDADAQKEYGRDVLVFQCACCGSRVEIEVTMDEEE